MGVGLGEGSQQEEVTGLMKVLVTGSRAWTDHQTMRHALTEIALEFRGEPVTLIHGGSWGADAMAGSIARRLGWGVEVHRAQWRPHGIYNAGAGLARNAEMVLSLRPGDMVLAFWKGGSTGTGHCIAKAREAGFEPIIFLEEA